MSYLDMYRNPQTYCQTAAARKCLPADVVRDLSTCYQSAPAGVDPWTHAAVCISLVNCGAFGKMGCPGDAEAMFGRVPACITSEYNRTRQYCLQNPTFRGPNVRMNQDCWKLSRYVDYRTRLMQRALCPGASGLGAPESTSRSIFGVGQDEPVDAPPVEMDAPNKRLLAAAAIGAVGIGFVALMMKKKKRGRR